MLDVVSLFVEFVIVNDHNTTSEVQDCLFPTSAISSMITKRFDNISASHSIYPVQLNINILNIDFLLIGIIELFGY